MKINEVAESFLLPTQSAAALTDGSEVIFPFQFASFLMTLVRKGIITTKGFHAGYLAQQVVAQARLLVGTP